VEIEAKLKVESLAVVEEKLRQLGAEFLAEQLQRDSYFDDARGSFAAGDRALRLRRQMVGEEKKCFLTYKGPKQRDDFKKREEIEFEVCDVDSAEGLLLAIGYGKALVYEKRRGLWRVDDCEVALDELVLLGSFVEIEGPSNVSIAAVQKKLGLGGLDHIVESYTELMAGKLRELGSDESEILF